MTDTLAFGEVLPATGQLRDFHTLENMRPPGALVNESVTELYISATLS